MYKWPQGRVIRTICLIIALIIAADLGFTGAYAKWAAANSEGQAPLRQLVLGGIFATAALAALIAGIVAAGFHKRSVEFLIDVEQEMVRVEWPKPNQLVRSTIIIAIAMCVLALIIFGVDAINHWLLFDVIFKLGDMF